MFATLISPFTEFAFMRHALVACFALSLSYGAIGVLLVLRRMSLVGDALSHTILPGVALGFLFVGSFWGMSIGGFIVGLLVALFSNWVTRSSGQSEDASFAAFYLMSLALGVLLVSYYGSTNNLMDMLFGAVLAVDANSLLVLGSVSSLTLITLAIIYRPLMLECFDPQFLQTIGGRGWLVHSVFLVLVVMNLVAGFQSLGTLMAVGLLMLPATAARFWANSLLRLMMVASLIALLSGYCGLLLSFHLNVPSGPAIILTAGSIYLLSFVFGRYNSLYQRWVHQRHLAA